MGRFSNLKGSGVVIILEGLEGVMIEQSLRFDFKASNNQAKYEALITSLQFVKEMGATNLTMKCDFQVITS